MIDKLPTVSERKRTISFRHGDMLYMKTDVRDAEMASMSAAGMDGATEMMQAASLTLPQVSSTPTPAHVTDPSTNPAAGDVKEDDVDVQMSKMDGKIYRDRNEQM